MDIVRLREKCQGYAQCFDILEKRVTLCATEVIDTAMSEKNPNWFSAFRGKELKLEQFAIIEKRHESVRDLDFQAAIKLFLYRESKADNESGLDVLNISAVFAKYDLPRTYSAEKPSRFKKLVGNLVNRRNELTGHLSAEEIDAMLLTATAEELESIIYKYKESIQDLISFLAYFPDVKGLHPESHFIYAKRLFEETEHKYNITKYKMSDVIAAERFAISEQHFADICRQLHINTSTENGIRYFETDDYAGTVRVIRTIIENGAAAPTSEPKPNYVPAIAIIVTLLVLLTILLILLIPRLQNNGTSEEGSKNRYSYSNKDDETDPSGKSSKVNPSYSNKDNSSEEGSSTPISSSKKGKIRGTATLGNLEFSIDQKPSNLLTVTVDNTGATSYSLGWVNPAEVVIETSEKTYFSSVYGSSSFKISPSAKSQFTVNLNEPIEGEIEKITIKNVLPLSSAGLPEHANVTGLTAIIEVEAY